jgi:hypothetical protein
MKGTPRRREKGNHHYLEAALGTAPQRRQRQRGDPVDIVGKQGAAWMKKRP